MRLLFCSIIFIGSFLFSEAQQLVFPDKHGWQLLWEGDTLTFRLSVNDSIPALKFTIEGVNESGIVFDSLGNFKWIPSYNYVDRLENEKELTVIFQALLEDGRKARAPITFSVYHKNQPPVVDELPVFYAKLGANQYKISKDFVVDPDGDPIVFKGIPSQMPEGATINSLGQLSWTLSRNQFNGLKKNPITIEFIAQDQPSKAETKGKIRVQQTQLDLPPDMLVMPSDSVFKIKEDELISLKIYVSDPNGDDNIDELGFVCQDQRVPRSSFKINSSVQAEFVWSPGYDFVEEVEKSKAVGFTFFTIDKSSNRAQRNIIVLVEDTENMEEKDKLLYQKYRSSLIQAKALIDQLNDNYDYLSKAYKKAKRGKKHRAIVNASLGATTGISPVVLPNDQSKVVSAVGGTTVLTLGTLEATEILGKSKSDILERMKLNVEIRNQLQVEGDNFARKYALKSARRGKDFEADREKLLPIINNQKLVILELDASRPSYEEFSDKQIKKTFPDFSDEI